MRDQRGQPLRSTVVARLPPTIRTEVPMRLIGLAVVVVLCLALAPLGVEAQAGKVWRIGVLTTGNPRSAAPGNWGGFLQGLRESGYVEGRNIAFEPRYAEGKPDTFPDLAACVGHRKVDGILARRPWSANA